MGAPASTANASASLPAGAEARQEHDAFADALSEREVEVLYLHELLGETLAIEAARDAVLAGTLATAGLGARLGASVAAWLAELPDAELAQRLIGMVSGPPSRAGAELGRGRGGPRCMSCPIERDPLPAT